MLKWIAVGALALFVFWGFATNNTLVDLDENVNKATGQVQNVLQRQYELIPNLVETAKGEAKFEQDTFTQVANARAKAGGVINVNAAQLANDPEAAKKFQESVNEMQAGLGRLLAVSEKYPELKANKAFQDVRTELVGSINRVTVERRTQMGYVNEYNKTVRRVPGIVIAQIAGYKQKPYFGADEAAQKAPTVKF